MLEAPATILNSNFINLENYTIIVNKYGVGDISLMNNTFTGNKNGIFSILPDTSTSPTNLIKLHVSGGNFSFNQGSVSILSLKTIDQGYFNIDNEVSFTGVTFISNPVTTSE